MQALSAKTQQASASGRLVASRRAQRVAPVKAAVDATLAAGGIASVVGLAGILVATDPQKRREAQMSETGGDELEAVKKYFNTSGFERWNKIYGETDEVNKVQLDIRKGHAQTVDKVLAWLDADAQKGDGSAAITGRTVCDAGCGTGSLTLPLAERGARVSASDISAAMVGEAERRFNDRLAGKEGVVRPVFEAKDLESVSGKYDTVCCLDVMIHYPQDKADAMVGHLASLAERRVVVSFAPYTPQYALLKRIGELFPGPAKATRAYLHREEDVERALKEAGFKVTRREMTATSFYFSRLLEAVRD